MRTRDDRRLRVMLSPHYYSDFVSVCEAVAKHSILFPAASHLARRHLALTKCFDEA